MTKKGKVKNIKLVLKIKNKLKFIEKFFKGLKEIKQQNKLKISSKKV
jgi:hypothetical protein